MHDCHDRLVSNQILDIVVLAAIICLLFWLAYYTPSMGFGKMAHSATSFRNAVAHLFRTLSGMQVAG